MSAEAIRSIVTIVPGLYCAEFFRAGNLVSEIVFIWELWSPEQAQGIGIPDDTILATSFEWILGKNVRSIHLYAGVSARSR